jgi:hypothetical protein
MALPKSRDRFLIVRQGLTQKARNEQITRNESKIRVSPALAGGARVRFFRGIRVKDFPTLITP